MRVLVVLALLCAGARSMGESADGTLTWLDDNRGRFAGIADLIWEHAELGYLETESSALLQSTLADNGFEVSGGVAGLPTAFVATFGEGEPVIGVLAEFDALPGISQDARPVRRVIEGKESGHACGHHLFGAGSVAAAIATKRWMEANDVKGTLKLFGTPAEEGGSGKVYMVRAGLFDDVDIAIHWHASDRNSAAANTTLANRSASAAGT